MQPAASAQARPSPAARLPSLQDPIFGLAIPTRIYLGRLSEVTQDDLQRCGIVVSAAADYRYWTAASAETGGLRYAIIAGMVRRPGASWNPDAKGAFLRRDGDNCTAIDPGDAVFRNAASYAAAPANPVPIETFDSLAADAVQRYAQAYGSRTALVAALRSQHRYPDAAKEAVLNRALQPTHR